MPLPEFAFFLDRPDIPVTPQSDLWHRPLPAGPQANEALGSDRSVTYGAYFTLARAFLADDHCRRLRRALAAQTASPVGAIDAVAVNLVKHGAFYHPARIDVRLSRRRVRLVLNVAVSPQGQALIDGEVRSLRLLAKGFGAEFLPEVYLRGRSGSLPMFIGRWFEGFHEFHWSRDPDDGQLKLALWDPQQGAVALSAPQVLDLFRQSAFVMTRYLDLETLRHIGAWHHGAGDFVARPIDGQRIAVRLITVRRYAPLVNSRAAGVFIPALLLFLVKLSLQNRMDRRDGVHEPILAPESVVAATVSGFFRALARKARNGSLSSTVYRRLRQALGQADGADIGELVAAVAAVLEKGSFIRVWDQPAQRQHSSALHAALAAFSTT